MRKTLFNRNEGFTFLEMIVVLAIVIIVTIFAVANFNPSTNKTNLNLTTQNIETQLREAQTRAMSSEQGTNWGVYFSNSTNTPPFYSVFSGSYSPTTAINQYPLPSNLQFSTASIPLGGSVSVSFNQVSGLPPASTTIILNLIQGGAVVATSGISVNTQGTINVGALRSSSGGSGATPGSVGSWTTSNNSLPAPVYEHSSIAYNGYLYTIGGTDVNGNTTSTVQFAPINSNGTVGTWQTTTALPKALYWTTAVVYNGYLYAIGGNDGFFGATSTIQYAVINSTGSIGAWAKMTAFPNPLELGAAAAYNGYLYTVGGAPGPTSTVRFAPINSTGSLGAWTGTTALPAPCNYYSSVAYNGYLYTAGGSCTVAGNVTSTVQFAPINSTGSIGAWTSTTALPVAIYAHTTDAYNGYLYTVGGADASFNLTSTVNYAPINGNGTVGNWTSTTALPAFLFAHSGAIYNGNLYTTGGWGGSASSSHPTSTVYYAPLH